MDEIIVDNIKVFAHHGVFDFEKKDGQNFYVTVKMTVGELTRTDNLDNTVDYGKVATMVSDYVKNTNFDLIESVAHGIARMLLLEFDLVRSVEVTISKPDAPIPLEFDTVKVVARESKHIAYLGIGSNMGDKKGYLDMAVSELDKTDGIKVLSTSTYIETEPYGVLDQDKFLNGAVKIETILTPHELLDVAHSIESKANRVRLRRWGERTLDVDILLYDDLILNDDDLIIPHLELHMRGFVLIPLVEIGAGAVHPVLHKTAYQLLKELNI